MVTTLIMAFDVARRAFIYRAVGMGSSPAETDRALRAVLDECDELGDLVWQPCPKGVWRSAVELARAWVFESEAIRSGKLLSAVDAVMAALSGYASGTIEEALPAPTLSDKIGGA